MNLCKFHSYPDDYHTTSSFYISVMIFLLGVYTNVHSDSILRGLRNKGNGSYSIPYGGMFEYVSCANLFGEIIEWFGYMLACGLSIPSVAFFIYTCANLIPRAVSNHAWYHDKFEDYPKGRKAVIPFIL